LCHFGVEYYSKKKNTFSDIIYFNVSYDIHKDVNFKQLFMLKSNYELTKYIT